MGDVPSIHRLRWGDLDGDRRPDLVVAPIFGQSAQPPRFDQEGASLLVFFFEHENGSLKWHDEKPDARFLVMHAIDVLDRNGDGRSEILTASNDGISEVTRSTAALPSTRASTGAVARSSKVPRAIRPSEARARSTSAG